MTTLAELLPPVLLIPASLLESEFFQVLATFVALNSLIYATLAVLKVVPKGYGFFRFDGRNRRRQDRSIYPVPVSHEPSGPQPATAAPAEVRSPSMADAVGQPSTPSRGTT